MESITLTHEKNNCSLKYEAAVAGGIPIIKVIDEFLLSNKITKIYGILNGTSNYILSNMLLYNKDFKNILSEAQKLGYAESNPKFDIDGTDTAHKLSILSSLAFECYIMFRRLITKALIMLIYKILKLRIHLVTKLNYWE